MFFSLKMFHTLVITLQIKTGPCIKCLKNNMLCSCLQVVTVTVLVRRRCSAIVGRAAVNVSPASADTSVIGVPAVRRDACHTVCHVASALTTGTPSSPS